MRLFVAGLLTVLTFIPMYFFVPRMKASLSGFGTSLPKHMEILIALSDTFVNYYYVLLPFTFVTFFGLAALVTPENSKREKQ